MARAYSNSPMITIGPAIVLICLSSSRTCISEIKRFRTKLILRRVLWCAFKSQLELFQTESLRNADRLFLFVTGITIRMRKGSAWSELQTLCNCSEACRVLEQLSKLAFTSSRNNCVSPVDKRLCLDGEEVFPITGVFKKRISRSGSRSSIFRRVPGRESRWKPQKKMANAEVHRSRLLHVLPPRRGAAAQEEEAESRSLRRGKKKKETALTQE
jgi:hypothetical protein